jgi:hypothetical protein
VSLPLIVYRLTRFMRDETAAARLFYTALGVWVPLSLVLPWFWTTPTPRDRPVNAGCYGEGSRAAGGGLSRCRVESFASDRFTGTCILVTVVSADWRRA